MGDGENCGEEMVVVEERKREKVVVESGRAQERGRGCFLRSVAAKTGGV